MDKLIFGTWESVLLPIGVFAILLATWQFGFQYAQEGLLWVFLPKPIADWVCKMIYKAFGYIGYIAFCLMFVFGIWIIGGTINTLVQYYFFQKDIQIEIIIFCWAIAVMIAIVTIGMVYRKFKPYKPQDITKIEETSNHQDIDVKLKKLEGMIAHYEKLTTQYLELIKNKKDTQHCLLLNLGVRAKKAYNNRIGGVL
jgi:hypothetical protein